MMNKKKLLALACVMAVSLGALSGCGNTKKDENTSGDTTAGSSDTSEKIELVFGGLDRGNSADNKDWPTGVVENIQEKLNIDLTMINYDNQKLGLDLASGELPDVMLVYAGNIESVLKAKHAVPLNNYFDTIAKDLNSERFAFRNGLMAENKSNGDGNVYFTTPSVTNQGEGETGGTLGLGYAIRWDLYKEIGAPEINTQDDYIEAMKKMQALEPTTPDGLPTYAMSMYNDVGLHAWIYHGMLEHDYVNLDGNMMYLAHDETGDIIHNVMTDSEDTPFWTDMKFYNKLYNEGLLDPDCFVTKGEDLTAKYTKGQYLGGINNWYFGDYNNKVLEEGSNKGIVMLPGHTTGQQGFHPAGWSDKLMFASKGGKNIDRSVMFLNYINSEEFARVHFSGIEGVHWEKGEDGKPVLTEEALDLRTNPTRAEEFSKLGFRTWDNMAGVGETSMLSDGAPASLWLTSDVYKSQLSPTEKDMCETLAVDYPSQYAQKRVEEGKSRDYSKADRRFTTFMPTLPQDVSRIDNNVKEIVMNSLPNLVQAKDDTAFKAAREKLIADVKAANAEEGLKWWSDSVISAKEKVKEIDAK